MSLGPTVTANYFTERLGVLAVAKDVNSMSLVWRETPNADVGIDGQIEHVSVDGVATGRLVAVQVKSGSSYIHATPNDMLFYPQQKHAEYWRQFPIPVVLCLHDPATKVTYWTDARRQLIAPDYDGKIRVSKSARLGETCRDTLFESYGPIANAPLDARQLAVGLASIRARKHPSLSGLGLFLAGMTDIATKLFFDTSLLFEIAAFLEGESFHSDGVHPFIDEYLAYLFSNSLTRYDYAEYLVDLDRGLHPTFVAPLTAAGMQVRDFAHQFTRMHALAPSGVEVIEERRLEMMRNGRERLRFEAIQEMVRRLAAGAAA